MTRILIDTHTFLWFIGDDLKLSNTAKHILENQARDTYLSIVSLWEMAIKVRIDKLKLPRPYNLYIPEQLTLNAITILDLTYDHVEQTVAMPLDHREPFDRVIAAQALVEGLPLLSIDSKLDVFGIERIW
jgi:PIN domain nuclease of toxin-antitoxin system